ncbi:hypothetical protein [Mangrovibacter plantisponsor]|uniref:Uncharacterized protein n=1 Tax=Mangrovibacter plantisponsor TaxID=451513 RepID=A0A317Q5Y8_9ENTR|nr:hypothetical protein [Mangrovibacter plantisponsor]PWW11415.1 hypothetical protein DES37_10217 [Mangrovibacter plantisponsor]
MQSSVVLRLMGKQAKPYPDLSLDLISPTALLNLVAERQSGLPEPGWLACNPGRYRLTLLN